MVLRRSFLSWPAWLIVFVSGLAVFGIQSLAWPLSPGRDFGTYLIYYFERYNPDPVFPLIMTYRTPVVPLFFGTLLTKFGSGVTEVIMGLLYSLALVAIYVSVARWHRPAARLALVALLVYPPYGALFHTVGSESLLAAALSYWVAFVSYTAARPAARQMVGHALVVVLLVLIRPVNQVLLAFASAPWLLLRTRNVVRWRYTAAFLVPSALLLSLWATYNYVRYDDFTIARVGNAVMPLYRAFVIDRIVEPANGPATAELAVVVRERLLTQEPYASYQIDVTEFFGSGESRMFYDLIPLADHTWGWDDDYRHLRAVGREAVLSHPRAYLRGVMRSVGGSLILPYIHPTPVRYSPPPALVPVTPPAPVVLAARIPDSHLDWLATTPDGSIRAAWDAELRAQFIFRDPAKAQRYEELNRQHQAILATLPNRAGQPAVAAGLNRVARYYPPLLLWLLVGIAGWCVTPRLPRFVGLLVILASLVLLVTYMGIQFTHHYRIPFDPIFISFGSLGAVYLISHYRSSRGAGLTVRRRA